MQQIFLFSIRAVVVALPLMLGVTTMTSAEKVFAQSIDQNKEKWIGSSVAEEQGKPKEAQEQSKVWSIVSAVVVVEDPSIKAIQPPDVSTKPKMRKSGSKAAAAVNDHCTLPDCPK